MINRQRSAAIIIIIISTAVHMNTVLSNSVAPSSHLLPPPVSHTAGLSTTQQRLTYAKHLPAQQVQGNGSSSSQPPGFMQRVARWFGFGRETPQEQQLQTADSSYKYAQYKDAPQLNGAKAPCGLCNKYPWVPVFPASIQLPIAKLYNQPQHYNQWNQPQQQALQFREQNQKLFSTFAPPPLENSLHRSKHPALVQRAVQFNFPVQPTGGGEYHGPPPPPPSPPSTRGNRQNYNPQQQQQQSNFVPIPVPNLSASAIPPLYNAQPFRPIASVVGHQQQQQQQQHQHQPIQAEASSFVENIGALPQNFQTGVIPTQIPSTKSGVDFEIIKSHQVTDFVSSVEYPANFMQSQTIDIPQTTEYVTQQQQETQEVQYQTQQQQYNTPLQPFNAQYQTQQYSTQHQYTMQYTTEQPPTQYSIQAQDQQANTIDYQRGGITVNSQQNEDSAILLTELGGYGSTQYDQFTSSPDALSTLPIASSSAFAESFDPNGHQNYDTQPPNQNNDVSYTEAWDNYPSASSHNLTSVRQDNRLDSLDLLQPSSPSENLVQHPSAESENVTFIPTPEPMTTTIKPIEFVTEFDDQLSFIDIVPSLETTLSQQQQQIYEAINHHHHHHQQAVEEKEEKERKQKQQIQSNQDNRKHQQNSPNRQKDRETPKRLLDSPIRHIHRLIDDHGNSSPRPFTRDPSELNFRPAYPPLRQHQQQSHESQLQQLYSSEAISPLSPRSSTPAPSPEDASPTSTYSSTDASGHFAGMSPPNPPRRQLHQIIIPYTTKNQPRPFEPQIRHPTTPLAGRYDNWSHASDSDVHEQQESKLVSTATEPAVSPSSYKRTTKYLTKILASNLRELLKREHEMKNKSKANSAAGASSFDFSRLQKNIDDWTEQEFTSLSHKASTVSIRGRSKHIPTEYLTTTTPSMRQSKATSMFGDVAHISTSINNLETLLTDRGSKRYEFPPIVDNRIPEYFDTTKLRKKTTTTTQKPPTTTTTPVVPFYIRAISSTVTPREFWNQAKVAISPQTKEKVYVVTPQPRYTPQRTSTTTTTSTTQMPQTVSSVGAFKSPRFLVRPTPASGFSNITSQSKTFSSHSPYTPELFGLMGLSAYIPAAPVETFDGHSKVITVITPSNSSDNGTATDGSIQNHRLDDPSTDNSPSYGGKSAPSGGSSS